MEMLIDILLQIALISLFVFGFLYLHGIPQYYYSKLRSLRSESQTNILAKRHFVIGAQLLNQARSAAINKGRSASASASDEAASLAKSAAEEADKSISLNPSDAAAHILKALALELQGFTTSAIDSLDFALSPVAAKSLSKMERGEALFKRAELKLKLEAVSREERVDSVIDDLVESVSLRDDNGKAFALLGQCYERKGLKEEAQKAYEDAIRVEPTATAAQEALHRLAPQ